MFLQRNVWAVVVIDRTGLPLASESKLPDCKNAGRFVFSKPARPHASPGGFEGTSKSSPLKLFLGVAKTCTLVRRRFPIEFEFSAPKRQFNGSARACAYHLVVRSSFERQTVSSFSRRSDRYER